MKPKQILPMAIIAMLPFNAIAHDTYKMVNTPVNVPANAAAVASNYPGPYVLASIGDSDDEHIASTAYVKGAYNDAIAAVNTLVWRVDATQGELNAMDLDTVFDLDSLPAQLFVDELTETEPDVDNLGNKLLSAYAVAAGIKSQRVKIYTTWDDDRDSATAEVPFVTATGD